MVDRSLDWLRQALRDLDQASLSMAEGYHEWACFSAHQAAKKAVKALHLYFKQEAWGHVISRLLRELPSEVIPPQRLIGKAHVLDSYYLPTRYPNGHPEGAPFEHYGELQSQEAIQYVREIVEFVHAQMA